MAGELHPVRTRGHLREKTLRPRGWRSCNLRTQFGRIIKRAGLQAWPRLFHNLRASLETELLRERPIHVVTAWLGNSPRIALKHYCMVTDFDFDRARGVIAVDAIQNQAVAAGASASTPEPVTAPLDSASEPAGTESGTVVAQHASQQLHAATRKVSNPSRANPSPAVTSAKSCEVVRNPAKPKNGEGGIRTRGPAFDRSRL